MVGSAGAFKRTVIVISGLFPKQSVEVAIARIDTRIQQGYLRLIEFENVPGLSDYVMHSQSRFEVENNEAAVGAGFHLMHSAAR